MCHPCNSSSWIWDYYLRDDVSRMCFPMCARLPRMHFARAELCDSTTDRWKMPLPVQVFNFQVRWNLCLVLKVLIAICDG